MDIFEKIDKLTARPFCDCQQAARFLGCHARSVRRMIQAGEIGAVRNGPRGQWRVLSETVAASMVRSLWAASLDGAPIPVDLDCLETYARRFGVVDAVSESQDLLSVS